MKDFIELIRERIAPKYFENIEVFYNKLCNYCKTDLQIEKFEEGQQNTLIILPLELDYDMIFSGLILPLLRDNLIDEKDFEEYNSSFELARHVLTIENINFEDKNEIL